MIFATFVWVILGSEEEQKEEGEAPWSSRNGSPRWQLDNLSAQTSGRKAWG